MESTGEDETEKNRKEQEREAKKRKRVEEKKLRERQSNSSGKSNCWLFRNSIKLVVKIGHQIMRGHLIVTMSISLSLWMRVLLTANRKKMSM